MSHRVILGSAASNYETINQDKRSPRKIERNHKTTQLGHYSDRNNNPATLILRERHRAKIGACDVPTTQEKTLQTRRCPRPSIGHQTLRLTINCFVRILQRSLEILQPKISQTRQGFAPPACCNPLPENEIFGVPFTRVAEPCGPLANSQANIMPTGLPSGPPRT